VPPENEVLAEAAVRAGATDVLPWPAPDGVVRSRLRSVVLSALLQEEVAAFPHVLEEVVRAYEGREAHTIEHSARVARLSAELGRALGLSPSELERLRQAALIQNLGMLAIPAEVVGRAEALTADEEAIIRSHPRVGAEMLRSVPALEPLRPFVLMHHERIDGSGYPEGLSGSEIPLPVRILALTEAYDALTSTRPWRPARTHEGAMKEARAGRWDADLVEQLDGAVARLMKDPAERRL
jgi:HD-GYP domain-containing protein (c-di-GMP phosphodiesterase class II)